VSDQRHEQHGADSDGSRRRDGPPGLWQRQPGETASAHQAFLAYRAVGPDRTLRVAARRLGKSLSLLKRWSAGHDWVSRAEAWDAQEREQAKQEARSVRERAYRRRVEYAEQLEKVAMAGLRSLMVRDPESGQARFIKGLKPSEIADLIQVACRLLPPAIAERPDGDQRSEAEEELSQFNQADLERLNSLLAQERPEEARDGDDSDH
jgi:hypothetical protein